MGNSIAPPSYRSPSESYSFLATLRRSLSDPASVIPAAAFEQWAIKLPGPGFPVLAMHPDSVREVLLDKGERFGRNRQLRRMMRRAWGDGLAGAEGESWASQRHAAAPAFRPRAVEAVTRTMAEATRRVAQDWRDGETIELGEALGRIVTEVVLDALFSVSEGIDLDRAAADIPVVMREVTTFGMLDALPLPERLVAGLRGFGHSAEEARLRRLAASIAGRGGVSSGDRRNLLALLDGAGPLEDNTFGFMLAGFETSALGAAWASYLLALSPEWQERLAEEARAADGRFDALVLARQVAQEALRLYPPAPLLVRAAKKRTTIQGIALWPGQAVLIPVYHIHRHRRLWDRPDAFDPARFGPAATYDRAAFLPFGAGPRMCIAASFALAEITVIVSELAKAFRLAPAGPEPVVDLKVSTYSRNGLRVAVRPR